MTKRQEAILRMVAAALLFCLTEICMKKINGDLNGIQVNATRYFLAGLCLLPWSRKQLAARHTRITVAQQKACFLLGFVGITIVGPLYQMAAVALGASHTAVIFSSTPLFITVLAALLLGTPITRNEIIALGLQVLAIGVLVDPFHMTMDPFGLLGLFICVLGYSLYAVGGKKLMLTLGSVTVTACPGAVYPYPGGGPVPDGPWAGPLCPDLPCDWIHLGQSALGAGIVSGRHPGSRPLLVPCHGIWLHHPGEPDLFHQTGPEPGVRLAAAGGGYYPVYGSGHGSHATGSRDRPEEMKCCLEKSLIKKGNVLL